MPERIMPGLGLRAFYDPGQSDWGAMVSADLRKLSAAVQLSAKSHTTALPASGTAGDIYIVPSGAASNAHDIALWDGPAGSEAWVYLTPAEGWEAWLKDTGERVRFDGTAWRVVVPALSGNAGKALAVVAGEDALEFVGIGGATAPVTADANASRQLMLADAGTIVEMTAATANTVTIPDETTILYPVGTLINVTQAGAGTTTITAASGVTLNGVAAGACAIEAQWGGAALYKRGADAWVVQGAVSVVS